MSTLRTLLVTSRPRFWLYLAGPVLVGLVFGVESTGELADPLAIALLAYFLVPANLLLYGVNDIADADIDRHNPKKGGRERRFGGEAAVVAATIASLVLGLALVAVVAPPARPWLLGFFVLAVAYSLPPLRFKARPGLDSLSNGLYILPGVASYVATADALPPVGIIAGAWLWTMAMHTYSAVPDIGADRRGGVQTTATVLGRERTLAYCAVVWALAAAAFATVDLRAGALLSVYPVLVGAVAVTDVTVDRAYWAYPAINAVVGMVFTLAGLWGLVNG